MRIMNATIRLLKTGWLLFWWILGTAILWFPIAITGLFSRKGKLSFHICQLWMWTATVIALVKVECISNSRLVPGQSYVIVANHQSFFDIPAMMLRLGIPFRWVVKKEFKYVPMFGWALYLAGHIFVDRSHPKKSIKSLNDGVRNLAAGASVAFFAEGTRNANGMMGEFKSGAFITAMATGLPILPVTVNGSWRIMPDKNSLAWHPGPIQLVIGDPIDTSSYSRKNMDKLIEATRNAVAANLNPTYPAQPDVETVSS